MVRSVWAGETSNALVLKPNEQGEAVSYSSPALLPGCWHEISAWCGLKPDYLSSGEEGGRLRADSQHRFRRPLQDFVRQLLACVGQHGIRALRGFGVGFKSALLLARSYEGDKSSSSEPLCTRAGCSAKLVL